MKTVSVKAVSGRSNNRTGAKISTVPQRFSGRLDGVPPPT